MNNENVRFKGGYRVTLPFSRADMARVTFTGVDIHQRIREHDVAVIRATTRMLDWFNLLATGTPVQVDYWDANRVGGSFVGYVTNIRPTTMPSTNRYEREIVCVAASRVFRETDRKTYVNRTAPEIVSDIARRLGFTVVTKQHGLRRATVVQSGESYWEFLTRLAKRCGYVMQADGTTLYFTTASDMVSMFASRAPYLTDYGGQPSNGPIKAANVKRVDAWSGDSAEDDERLSDIAEFTAVTPDGVVHTVRQTPQSVTARGRTSRSPYIKYAGGITAYSRADALLLAKGAADNGALAFDTRLTTAGHPGLRPYRPVMLDLRERTFSGYWVVKEANHHLSNGNYECEVVVSNDSARGSGWTPALRGVRQVRDIGNELARGFSPDANSRSRLRVTRGGFVNGVFSGGNLEARWSAS